jgi:outer membrane protein OmpA-like peptidoglycan-associated protein
VTAELTLTASDGTPIRDAREIPIRHSIRSKRFSGEIVRDSLVERYNLMLFDFDSPKVSDFNRPVIEMIQARMRTNSAVRITGYTDRIGDDTYNASLSQNRANSTSQVIKSRIIPAQVSAAGAGETLIYNNDLPEGRFYNRTVMIEIATPATEE